MSLLAAILVGGFSDEIVVNLIGDTEPCTDLIGTPRYIADLAWGALGARGAEDALRRFQRVEGGLGSV